MECSHANMASINRFIVVAVIFACGLFGQVVPSKTVIQYSDDFTSVTYLDEAGSVVTVPYMDSQRFSDLVAIRGLQLQAAIDNKNAASSYNQAVQNAQISINAGRPAPELPAKPQHRVVSNSGAISYIDFSPPLMSLVPVVVNAPSTGSIKSPSAGPDPAVQQNAQLTVILNQLSAIIAALRAKGIL